MCLQPAIYSQDDNAGGGEAANYINANRIKPRQRQRL